jgi:hypothetical protein
MRMQQLTVGVGPEGRREGAAGFLNDDSHRPNK